MPTRMGRLIHAIDANVVHVRWSGGGFVPIQLFKSLGRPVVWTLRDMSPFTGGCH